ncbi:hypothetical protein F383_04761 [Gossypium arboreum]|uniref:Uncharacterized protein n=1 Tax=Gossypium arboreum TaxID=29729 RepID=A0A0B0NRZ1_GOSAR|nr:hypothetical protein F383_04761 [Gossypium arboreum]
MGHKSVWVHTGRPHGRVSPFN